MCLTDEQIREMTAEDKRKELEALRNSEEYQKELAHRKEQVRLLEREQAIHRRMKLRSNGPGTSEEARGITHSRKPRQPKKLPRNQTDAQVAAQPPQHGTGMTIQRNENFTIHQTGQNQYIINPNRNPERYMLKSSDEEDKSEQATTGWNNNGSNGNPFAVSQEDENEHPIDEETNNRNNFALPSRDGHSLFHHPLGLRYGRNPRTIPTNNHDDQDQRMDGRTPNYQNNTRNAEYSRNDHDMHQRNSRIINQVNPRNPGSSKTSQEFSQSQTSYQQLKDKERNRSAALKLVLDYYHKHPQFTGTENEDWRRHLAQFELLCEEFGTDSDVRLVHFAHSLKPTSNAYHLYQKHKSAGKSWHEIINDFEGRYHSEVRRSRAARQMKKLKFADFKKNTSDEEEAFRNLIGELERLSCLADDEDQTNHSLCSVLWSAVEGCPWALHAQAKSGIGDDYPIAVEALTDYIQKFTLYGNYSSNPYPSRHNSNPYPTLEAQEVDDSSSDSEPTDIHYADQRRFKH